MITNNISLGSIDINFNDLHGVEDGKPIEIDGSISLGLSINGSILNKLEPLFDQVIRFNTNKQIGKDRIQRELDEIELLRLKVQKARLERQLRDLEK